jgi:hypothetical protein
MQTVTDALNLLKRQAELESAIKEPGGIRLTEEQELHVLRRQLQQFPEPMQAVIQAAHAVRRPLSELTAQDVEMWAGDRQVA